MERLDRQVDAYVTWKRDLIREITRYRSWLLQRQPDHRRHGSQVREQLQRRRHHRPRAVYRRLVHAGWCGWLCGAHASSE